MGNYPSKAHYNIVIIGCGGTGGLFSARLAQFLSTAKESSSEVILVDGDIVEEKNMARQPYFEEDIAQSKALSLAMSVEETYGLKWGSYCHYIETPEALGTLFSSFEKKSKFYSGGAYFYPVNILIGCCDNHRCRQVMEKFFSSCPDLIYYDSANEFSAGEVVIGIRKGKKLISPSRKFYFPEVMRSRGKRASELSCGTVNLSAPQHLATNNLAANVLLTLVAELVTEGKLRTGMVTFDSFSYQMNYRPYCSEVG